MNPLRWSWKRWLVAVVVVGFLGAVGGPFVYIHFVEGAPPKKLSLDSVRPTASGSTPASSGPADSGSVEGAWKVGADSKVGYRVKETLFGQSTTAVGRTSDVTGRLTIAGTTVNDASFTAQMATVKSDQSNRDGQFRGRIMDVEKFPTSTFVISKPLDLGALPAEGVVKTYQVSGKLTLHGVTKDVTIDLSAKLTGGAIAINGEIPIHFPDYSIPNPTFGPASVGDDGTLEVLLALTKS